MYAIKNQAIEKNSLENMSRLKNISDEYILLNEDEVYEFINNSEEFIDLINASLKLFKKHFPNAKFYLALEEDYECSALDGIFAYIVNKEASFEENSYLEELLLDDFIKLHDDYPKSYLRFSYDVEEDDEYYELWRKGIIDNY